MAINQDLGMAHQKTAETIFLHNIQFIKLQQQARCSGASIIRLACAIALQAYSSIETITLSFQHEDSIGVWNSWIPNVDRSKRVLALLMECEDQPANTAKHAEAQYALRVSSLKDDVLTISQPTSLMLLKKDYPSVSFRLLSYLETP